MYEIIKYKNNEFSKKTEQILKKNAYSNVWRWQEFSFKENIYKTMLDLIPELNNIPKNEMYNFKTFQN